MDHRVFHTSWLSVTFFNRSVTLHMAKCEKAGREKARSGVNMVGKRYHRQKGVHKCILRQRQQQRRVGERQRVM